MELASLAQLERSHRRHDEVMAELLEAARRLAAGRPEDGDVARVHEAVAYFERAVTRHFLDEEGSVFPRLSTRRPELAAELAALSADHPGQIEMQSAIAAAARGLDGEARPAAGKALLDAATRLAEAHRVHVAREDAVFGIAREALTAEDDEEIVAEMGTRRDRQESGRIALPGGGGGRGGGGGGGGGRGGGGGGGGGKPGWIHRSAEISDGIPMLVDATPSARAAAVTMPAIPTAKAKQNGTTAPAKSKKAKAAKPAAKTAKPAAKPAKPAKKPKPAPKAKPSKAKPAAKSKGKPGGADRRAR